MEKFGYRCPECGRGIVKQQEFLNYRTKVENFPFVVPKAIIGVCDVCGRKNFDSQEYQRWVDLYKKDLESSHILLSAKEILNVRKLLGLTMESFAHLIGCTRQSIYNWEKKNKRIPQSRMANLIITLIKNSIYKDKINVVQFLSEEARKLKVDIKIKEDIASIISHKEYKAIPHPIEEYSKNYKNQEGEPGFSPKLKSFSLK